MYETNKTINCLRPEELEILKGKGIDIGCGPDPVTSTCFAFDKNQGDANHILEYVTEKFDFVWSSHCLEHMHNPQKSLLDWWKLVKPGGSMFLVVPDEDLYEQGVFPSRFNTDHKWTFTISKQNSWSAVSINVLDLVKMLPDVEHFEIRLQDSNYNRKLMFWGNSCKLLKIPWYLYLELKLRFGLELSWLEHFASIFCSVDQTMHKDRMAQIFTMIKKRS